MKGHTRGDASNMHSGPSRPPVDGERNFEAIFNVPVIHRLILVRSRSRGGLVSGVYWEHEEYDARGMLIGRYESFAEGDQAGVRVSGWRKFDRAGCLIEEGEWLG